MSKKRQDRSRKERERFEGIINRFVDADLMKILDVTMSELERRKSNVIENQNDNMHTVNTGENRIDLANIQIQFNIPPEAVQAAVEDDGIVKLFTAHEVAKLMTWVNTLNERKAKLRQALCRIDELAQNRLGMRREPLKERAKSLDKEYTDLYKTYSHTVDELLPILAPDDKKFQTDEKEFYKGIVSNMSDGVSALLKNEDDGTQIASVLAHLPGNEQHRIYVNSLIWGRSKGREPHVMEIGRRVQDKIEREAKHGRKLKITDACVQVFVELQGEGQNFSHDTIREYHKRYRKEIGLI